MSPRITIKKPPKPPRRLPTFATTKPRASMSRMKPLVPEQVARAYAASQKPPDGRRADPQAAEAEQPYSYQNAQAAATMEAKAAAYVGHGARREVREVRPSAAWMEAAAAAYVSSNCGHEASAAFACLASPTSRADLYL